MTTPKERPIIFSAPMVRSILAGKKTQTRRIVKPQPPRTVLSPTLVARDALAPSGYSFVSDEYGEVLLRCPYGVPGDQLYVKEAWHTSGEYNRRKPSELPDDAPIEYLEASDYGNYFLTGRYRHARFMPRWASRITLEVTDVRVERLQGISEADAFAEGIETTQRSYGMGFRDYRGDPGAWFTDARTSYQSLWDQINGPGSWDANPWVWVVSFKRIVP